MAFSHPILRVLTNSRVLLFVATLLVYFIQVATWDCHFCFYFRTPFGVTGILLPATLLLWLRYPGFILAMALSFLTFALAMENVVRQRASALMDYGPERWVQPAFAMSWSYLLAMVVSIAIVWYALASMWRSTRKREHAT
jgi:hypothetical protein